MTFATRTLGTTSLTVSELSLGCASLAGNMARVSNADGRSIVQAALDAGVNYVDTAPFYGHGKSEHLVGDALRGQDNWVLSTKVGRLLKPRKQARPDDDPWVDPAPFEPVFDFSYDAIMRSYEDSQQRLGLNRIDILYMHDVDDHISDINGGDADFRAAFESTYKALDELRRAGDIKAIGLGINQTMPMMKALDHGQWDCFLLAGRYTLLEQGPLQTVLPAIAAHGASIVTGGPFNSGILVGGSTWNYQQAPQHIVERVDILRRVCDAHNVPLAAAALQFPLAHPTVACNIPGPRSVAEFQQIATWMRTPIPTSLWSDLRDQKAIHPDAPVPA
jgi:D-threo-aldose 1-dehydrogenase